VTWARLPARGIVYVLFGGLARLVTIANLHRTASRTATEAVIDYDYWMLQLTTIKDAGASGIIFWGGYQTQWDDTQDWWRATLDFIATI
jgi:hypothetical protein